jgi:hypothetical protein
MIIIQSYIYLGRSALSTIRQYLIAFLIFVSSKLSIAMYGSHKQILVPISHQEFQLNAKCLTVVFAIPISLSSSLYDDFSSQNSEKC